MNEHVVWITIGNRSYRKELFDKAVAKTEQDDRLKKDIEKLKTEYINRWYNYFICEERLK